MLDVVGTLAQELERPPRAGAVRSAGRGELDLALLLEVATYRTPAIASSTAC